MRRSAHKIVAALGHAKKRQPIPWKLILSSRQMWTRGGDVFLLRLCLNMFLVWYPKYLDSARGYTLNEMGFFASLPLAAGVVGDICGGVFSDLIIHRTGRIKFARQSVAITGFLIGGDLHPARPSMSPTVTSAPRCSAAPCSGWNWWWAMPGR